MIFLVFSSIEIEFDTESFILKSYSVALPTARQIELINKYQFAKAILDKNSKTFVVHIVAIEALEALRTNVQTFCESNIGLNRK